MLKVKLGGNLFIKAEIVNTVSMGPGLIILRHDATLKCAVLASESLRRDVIKINTEGVDAVSKLFAAYLSLYDDKSFSVYHYRERARMYTGRNEIKVVTSRLRDSGELIDVRDVISVKDYSPLVIETDKHVFYDMLIKQRIDERRHNDLLNEVVNAFTKAYPDKRIVSVKPLPLRDVGMACVWFHDRDEAFEQISAHYQTTNKKLIESMIVNDTSPSFIGYLFKE